MAFTLSDNSNGRFVQANASTTLTVPSFTPTANSLNYIAVCLGGDVTPDSIVGHGTWSLVATASTSGLAVKFYGYKAGASPSASTVVFTYADPLNACAYGMEVSSGHDTASDLATNNIQVYTGAAYFNNSGNLTIDTPGATMSAFATDSLLLTFGGCSATGFSYTPVSPLTQLTQTAGGTNSYNVNCASSETADTTPELTPSAGFGPVAMVALEIKAAGAGGGGSAINSIGQIIRNNHFNGQSSF